MRVEWTDLETGVRRTGEVWSDGPYRDALWVIPDDPRPNEGRAVCIHFRSTVIDGVPLRVGEAGPIDRGHSSLAYHREHAEMADSPRRGVLTDPEQAPLLD